MKIYNRLVFGKRTAAATKIQSHWRAYDCTMNYLHTMADVLIVQSVVRRWLSIRFVNEYRAELMNLMAITIQKFVRGWKAQSDLKAYKSARKIQKIWRGFQTYTDYLFTIADIIIVQRTMRQWLACRRVNEMRRIRDNHAAVCIQKIWRGYSSHMNMILSLVNIIIVQVRRLISRIMKHWFQ